MAVIAIASGTSPPPATKMTTTAPPQRTLFSVRIAIGTQLLTRSWWVTRSEAPTLNGVWTSRTTPAMSIAVLSWSRSTTTRPTRIAGSESSERRISRAPSHSPSRSGSAVASRMTTLSTPKLVK